jgi:hypothetical protein
MIDRRKFWAYVVFAFWITITAVLVGTVNQWGIHEALLAANMQTGMEINETVSAIKESRGDESKELAKKSRESETNTKSFDEGYFRFK